MAEYTLFIEKGENVAGVSVPNLEGCVSPGATGRAEANIRQATELHLQGMREDSLPIPQSTYKGRVIANF